MDANEGVDGHRGQRSEFVGRVAHAFRRSPPHGEWMRVFGCGSRGVYSTWQRIASYTDCLLEREGLEPSVPPEISCLE